jgi:hypothetical protein
MLNLSRILGGILLIVICLFSIGLAQSESSSQIIDPDISKFVAESLLKTNQAHFRLVSDYTYKMRRTVTRQNGETSSTLFESYFPPRLNNKGRTGGVIVTLEENGKVLSAKEIEKQRREAAEKLQKIAEASEQKSTSLEEKRDKGVPLDWMYNNVSVGLSSFLQVCEFHTPLREVIGGRETIILSFDRCDASKLSADKSYMVRLQGKVWFDALEKIPVRLEAWQRASLSLPPKTLILFTQKRIAEAAWFPSLVRVEGIGNEAVFPGLKINWQLEFFDYKLPQTEIKDVKIGSEK